MVSYEPLLEDSQADSQYTAVDDVKATEQDELEHLRLGVAGLCVSSGWKGRCIDPVLALTSTIHHDTSNHKLPDAHMAIKSTCSTNIRNDLSWVHYLTSRLSLYKLIHSQVWISLFTITCGILFTLSVFEYPLNVGTGRHGGDWLLLTSVIEIVCLLFCLLDSLAFLYVESYTEVKHTLCNTLTGEDRVIKYGAPVIYENIQQLHNKYPSQIDNPESVFRINISSGPKLYQRTPTSEISTVFIVREEKSLVIPLRRWIVIRFIALLASVIDILIYLCLFSRHYSLTSQHPLGPVEKVLTVLVFRWFRWGRVVILISRLRQFRHILTGFIYAFVNSIQLFVVNIIVIIFFGLFGFLLLSNTAEVTPKLPIAFDTVYDSIYYTLLAHLAPARVIQIIVPYYRNNEWVSIYAMTFIFVLNMFLLNLLVALGYKAYKQYIKTRYVQKYQRRKDAFAIAYDILMSNVHINSSHLNNVEPIDEGYVDVFPKSPLFDLMSNLSSNTTNDEKEQSLSAVAVEATPVDSMDQPAVFECILLETWMQLCRYIYIHKYNINEKNNNNKLTPDSIASRTSLTKAEYHMHQVDKTAFALFEALKTSKMIHELNTNDENIKYAFMDLTEASNPHLDHQSSYYIEGLTRSAFAEACLLLQLAEPSTLTLGDEMNDDDDVDGESDQHLGVSHSVNSTQSSVLINVNNIQANLQALDRVHSNDSDYIPRANRQVRDDINVIDNISIDLNKNRNITASISATTHNQQPQQQQQQQRGCAWRLRKTLFRFFTMHVSDLCCSNHNHNHVLQNSSDSSSNSNNRNNPSPITPVPTSSPVLLVELLSLIPILLSLIQLVDFTVYRSHHKDDLSRYQRTTWGIIGNVLLGFFFLEIVLKVWVLGWRRFKASRLNILDVIITFGGLVVFIDGGASHLSHYFILSLRFLRVFRLFMLVPPLKSIFLILSYVLPSLYTIMGVFFCLMYGFAILFNDYFGGRLNPAVNEAFRNGTCDEWLPNHQVMSFDDLWTSLITLTNMATLANWPMLINPVKIVTGNGYVGIALLFIYRILVTMVVFPTFLGFVMDTFNKNMGLVLANAHDEQQYQQRSKSRAANDSVEDIISACVHKANTSRQLHFNDNIIKYTEVTVDLNENDNDVINKYKYLYQ